MLIPDAYMVSITLVSLVLNAANFYLKAFGSNINGINVETHLSPAVQAVQAAPAAPAVQAAPAAPAAPAVPNFRIGGSSNFQPFLQ